MSEEVTWKEVLEEFKEGEQPHEIVPLMTDEVLVRALSAWGSIRVEVDMETKWNGDMDKISKWEYLWMDVKYSGKDFSEVVGLKEHEAHSILSRLIGMRLIYPDNTMHNLAQLYLGSLVAATMKKKR